VKTQQEAVSWALQQEEETLEWGGFSQCVAFVRNYVDFLGYPQPPSIPGAKDLWTVDWGPNFTKHKDPQPGDIGIYGPTSVNKSGHTDVVVQVTGNTLLTMDQNLVNPIIGGKQGSPIEKVTWVLPSSRIIGFIRPKFKEGASMTTEEATAVLDSFYGRFTGRKVKNSELSEYIPYLVGGEPDKFFSKAWQFDEVKKTVGTVTPDPDGPKWRGLVDNLKASGL
jgi:hypothetical protein